MSDDDNPTPQHQSARDAHKALGMWPIRRALALAVSTAVLLLIAAWFGLTWLLGSPPQAKPKPLDTTAQLELLKLVFALVAGVGALVALVTAYRRQRIDEAAGERAERVQAHAERVTRATAHDAIERRVTELYGQAVEQLGHDKAAVRLGGLYALERLAQDHPAHRQTITDVVCAYLRMPYHLPPEPEPDTPPAEPDITARQELQVRLAAQRLLKRHLTTDLDDPPDTYWPNLIIDLTEAHLIDFDLTCCHIHHIELRKVQFSGEARFDQARFSGEARFDGARFGRAAWFTRTQFGEAAWFARTRFAEEARFDHAQFGGETRFDQAQFNGEAQFGWAQFSGLACFDRAQFRDRSSFDGGQFRGAAVFEEARFGGEAWFIGTEFGGAARFDKARFSGGAQFLDARFNNTTSFDRAQFSEEAKLARARFSGVARFRQTHFQRSPDLDGVMAHPTAESHWPDGWDLDLATDAGAEMAPLVRQQ